MEVRRSILDPILKDCPQCCESSLEVVLHAVEVIDTTPRTLGGQADHNHRKAGAYERENRQMEIEKARQRARAENLPDGMTSIRKPVPDSPWWRPGEKQIKPSLVRSGPQAKQKYIEEGKI